ncbi:MAG: NAD(P)/FAD-dependent oxidoreductase [Janthinobacterium lividum]
MTNTASGRLPNTDFERFPIWWKDAPPQDMQDEPRPRLPARCDVAVVGGGFSGLATALELARQGVSVAVLEADAFGFNSSGRNSGGVSFGLDFGSVNRWRRWTGSQGPGVGELARGALESLTFMQDFIAQNAIDCDFHLRGRLSCAPTPKHYDILARRAEQTNKLYDAGAYMVSRADQHSEIGSDQFYGTMVIPRSAQLQPARYLHALLALCAQAGVQLFGNTAVLGTERQPAGFILKTAGAALQATAVVLATNAQAGRLPGSPLTRHVVPVVSNIIVTEALPDELAARLLPQQRTGADNRRLLAYFRRTPDGSRFLYGGRAAPFEVTPERAAAILYRRMVKTFPQLDRVRIDYAWGCKVAFTFDSLPHIGQMDGLYYIAGCNGNGVAMMNYLGYHLARKILDNGQASCVFDQVNFPTLPLYSGKPWFLPILATGYGILDRLDDSSRPRR